MKIFSIFTVFSFLLLVCLSKAANVEVLYFYSASCPISQELQQVKEEIKNFWKNNVNWIEYDFIKNKETFDKYLIFNTPVAIVNCFNKSYRIERNEISTKLNSTIAECFKCNGTIILDKECEIGDVKARICGKCGVSYSYCSNNCRFSPWSECKDEKECYPNEIEKRPCSIMNCEGYQTRICNSTCYWGEWSKCEKIDPKCVETIIILPEAKVEYEPEFLKGIASVMLIFIFLILSLVFLKKFYIEK